MARQPAREGAPTSASPNTISDVSTVTEHFLIMGCQRTGTTLMRLILECHSQIECCDEERSYNRLAAGATDSGSLAKLIGFKIPRWTEQLRNATLTDAGLPVVAKNWYAGQRIIFLVRDVRDTVVSMMNLRLDGASWLESWGIPAMQERFRVDPTYTSRFGKSLEVARSFPDPLPAMGALYWKYKTVSYLDYAEHGMPIFPVHYEDLVQHPLEASRRVCRFLGIPWEDGLLSHPKFAHSDLSHEGLTIGLTDPRREVDEQSVGQWRRQLCARQVEEIMAVAGDVQEYFYPDTTHLSDAGGTSGSRRFSVR